jgi:DNA-binding response OmpR family regulator
VPAIALTAFARSEDRLRALEAGFSAHISKPVEPSELIATVASVVGRRRPWCTAFPAPVMGQNSAPARVLLLFLPTHAALSYKKFYGIC